MGSDRKLLTCRACGDTFAVPRSRGSYPVYCSKPECQDSKREAANAVRRVPDRRAEQMRERNREGLSQIANRARHQQPEPEPQPELEPDESTPLVVPEVEAVRGLVAELDGVARTDLRSAVRKVAYAEGAEATYAHLLEVAAVAVAWARRIRPQEGAIEVYEHGEDYGELIAA